MCALAQGSTFLSEGFHLDRRGLFRRDERDNLPPVAIGEEQQEASLLFHPQQCDCPQLLAGSALFTGRKHDGRIRVTRWPRGKPPAGPFNVSGPTLGRSEMP